MKKHNRSNVLSAQHQFHTNMIGKQETHSELCVNRVQDMGSKKKKFRFVYLLCFSKMGFGTLADNFIALRIMTIKKSKASIIRWGGLTSRHFFGGEEH